MMEVVHQHFVVKKDPRKIREYVYIWIVDEGLKLFRA